MVSGASVFKGNQAKLVVYLMNPRFGYLILNDEDTDIEVEDSDMDPVEHYEEEYHRVFEGELPDLMSEGKKTPESV